MGAAGRRMMITCEVCGEKPAKIHVTQIKDGKKITIHMCQECAHKQALGGSMGQKFSMSGLLAGFLSQEAASSTSGAPTQEELLTCEACGQTYRAFKESGKLGCAACYDTFEKQLLPLLGKIQKRDRHVGKRPRGTAEPSLEEQRAELRLQLKQAVEREEFERAAALRDEIKELRQELVGFV